MPMGAPETTRHTDAPLNQLSLHFPSSPHTSKEHVADKVHAITSGKVTFHVAETRMEDQYFTVKASYMGRSYTIKGIYRQDQIRSFAQEDFSATVVSIVRFDSILIFRDGRYFPAILPGKEYDTLTKDVGSILSSSLYNRTIH